MSKKSTPNGSAISEASTPRKEKLTASQKPAPKKNGAGPLANGNGHHESSDVLDNREYFEYLRRSEMETLVCVCPLTR